MPVWALVVIGAIVGLALIYGIIRFCIWLEERGRKRKSCLAEPSGNWDAGPSIGGSGPYDAAP